MTRSSPKTLLTGASGTLGSELVKQLWKRNPNLVSAGRTNKQPFPEMKIPFVPMNLEKIGLGIQNPSSVWADVKRVVHCAADVRWNLPQEKAIQMNTEATRTLIDQVRHHCPKLEQFVYVSTAFVDTPDTTSSNIGPEHFNNSYEYSKYLAEQELIHSGLPWTIIRPSIIIGRQDTGEIDRFLSVYLILKLYEQRILPLLVGYPDAILDLIPVDVVVDSILHALDHTSECLGKIIYASSGSNAVSLATVTTRAHEAVNQQRHLRNQPDLDPIKIVDPQTFERFFLPLMRDTKSPVKLPRTFQVVQKALECFRPYLKIKKKRVFEKNELFFSCEGLSETVLKCFNFWCQTQMDVR